MQVTLSWDETVVPEGQLVTQVPLERKDPGKQEVHFFWLAVDATLKLGIWHAVHLAPQAERKKHQLSILNNWHRRLTITFPFIVVSDKTRPLTNAIWIGRYTSAVKSKETSSTDDAIAWCSSGACLAWWGTRRTSSTGAEATDGTCLTCGSYWLRRIAFGRIVRILGEPWFTGGAITCTIGTLSATQLANLGKESQYRRKQEESMIRTQAIATGT